MNINGHVKDAAKGTPYVVVTLCSFIWLLIQGGVIQSRVPEPEISARLEAIFRTLEAVDVEKIPMTWWPRRHGPVMADTLTAQKETNILLGQLLEMEKKGLECLQRIELQGQLLEGQHR